MESLHVEGDVLFKKMDHMIMQTKDSGFSENWRPRRTNNAVSVQILKLKKQESCVSFRYKT